MVAYIEKTIKLVDCQIDFVEKQILTKQNTISCPYKPKNSKLKWTGGVVDFVELFYSVQAIGYINDGKITLKELFDIVCEVFDIEIKDFSRTFSDVKNRGNCTKFLKELSEALRKKLGKSGEKWLEI